MHTKNFLMKNAELKLKKGENIYNCCQKLMLMVRELHCQGFEKLRIVPHISPSGLHWRCDFLPSKLVLKRFSIEKSGIYVDYKLPCYTSGAEYNYFNWEDGKNLSLTEMAERFVETFPKMMNDCRGNDKRYTDWFFKMLLSLDANDLPYFFSDDFIANYYIATTKGNRLPMPPAGEAEM